MTFVVSENNFCFLCNTIRDICIINIIEKYYFCSLLKTVGPEKLFRLRDSADVNLTEVQTV